MSLKKLYDDINYHLMNDEKPSLYFNEICDDNKFKEYPFNMLYNLKLTNQSPKHHPEGNVFNHTLLVVDEAAKVKHKSKNPNVFMWAALLHDIGKPSTTRNRKGKITSYNHDKVGEELAYKFLSEFTDDTEFINSVTSLIRWHMHILYVVNDLPFGNVNKMRNEADINEVALLGLCDRLGRLNADRVKEEGNIKTFINKLR